MHPIESDPCALSIRAEASADSEAISTLVAAAFRGHPQSAGHEPHIVSQLRERGELAVSLVAQVQQRVVGYVAFSPVTITGGAAAWFGLGPLVVDPAFQARGIGIALVRTGLQMLATRGANGCVVFGNAGYYRRFGFAIHPQLIYPEGPAENFLGLPFVGAVPRGFVAYASGFGVARSRSPPEAGARL